MWVPLCLWLPGILCLLLLVHSQPLSFYLSSSYLMYVVYGISFLLPLTLSELVLKILSFLEVPYFFFRFQAAWLACSLRFRMVLRKVKRLAWLLGQWSVYLQCGRPRFSPWVGKIPWKRKWQPTPVFLPGRFHGRRSLVGYSPWGCKELDTTEWLLFVSLRKVKNFIVCLFLFFSFLRFAITSLQHCVS